MPISTGGGQVLYAGTYLPSDGDPEKVGAEVCSPRYPWIFGAGSDAAAGLRSPEQILARLRRTATPGWKPTRRSRGWDANSSATTSAEEPLEYAGFVASKVWLDLVRPGPRT